MRRARKPAKVYTCERCGAPAGTHGVTCDPCEADKLVGLLSSKRWREARPHMVETIERDLARLGQDYVVECVRCDARIELSCDQAHLIGSAVCPDCARAERDDRLAEEADAQ